MDKLGVWCVAHMPLIVLKGTLNGGFCSPYKNPISIAGDRTTEEDVGIIGNTLQALTMLLKFKKDSACVLQDSGEIIHIRTHILIAVTSIADPDIGVGVRWTEIYILEGLKKEVMKGFASSAQAITSLASNHKMASLVPKFRTSNKVDQLNPK